MTLNSCAAITALEQVHAELQYMERRQRLEAILRPPKDPSELLQPTKHAIRAHNAGARWRFKPNWRAFGTWCCEWTPPYPSSSPRSARAGAHGAKTVER